MTLLIADVATAQVGQIQKTEILDFEVVSVNGNTVVVNSANGAREVTVPDDYRFSVDGKPVSVHDLQAGQKGTAMVTTTTTIRPVYVTTVRKGTVVKRVRDTVYVKTEDGSTRKFTKTELEQRGIQVVMDGKPVRLADLKGGDQLTATIVTSAPPLVLTEKEVLAVLAAPEEAPAAEEPAAATPVAAKPAEATPVAVAAEATPAAEPPPAATETPVVAATTEEVKTEEKPDRTWLWIGVVAVGLIIAFLLLRKKKPEA
jgi:hypothetical protein